MSQYCLCIVKFRHRNVKISYLVEIINELNRESEIKSFNIVDKTIQFLEPTSLTS
jgi:hypothetical protein